LTQIPLLIYLLIFISALPVAFAVSPEMPFPDISFMDFSKFVNSNFGPQVSLTTVLMILFSMTENPELLNLHARQKNPQCVGEMKQSSSGWIRALARSLIDKLEGKTKSLFNENEVFENNLITPLTVKLDELMDVLKLNPFSKSGKLKKKLLSISHQEITPIHLICPQSLECEDIECDPCGLHQATRERDIPSVTLIKGNKIYKKVAVLSGKCPKCETLYYADHESLDRSSDNPQRVYLNSAKYLKVGQSVWVDRVFSSAVVNAIYSFHSSAAAYMEFWNNSYASLNPESTCLVSRRIIWQAFVQESIRDIGLASNQHLTLSDKLSINEVTQEAFTHLGNKGIIAVADGHNCSECSQPYRRSQYEAMDQIEEGRASVKMVVVDGIVMGPTHCAYGGCTSDLINARGGSFCPFHETQYGAKCRVYDCQAPKINPSQACEQHQPDWQKYIQTHSRENLSGVRRMLRRPGENLPWQPNIQRNLQPHDQEIPEHQRKNYFSPNRFYCVETICAPCGTVIAWTKFAKSESPTHILEFLAKVFPTEESRPDYICIDKACLVMRTSITNGSWAEWEKTTRMIVDAFHYNNHSKDDNLCRTWCNPAPRDGSAPNLVIPAVDKNGQPCLKKAFNTQVSY
jgi:CxC5 like cysteine cluster associated with KDZ transposases/CxC6 like cysteine cluster associated with KDZ transposases